MGPVLELEVGRQGVSASAFQYYDARFPQGSNKGTLDKIEDLPGVQDEE